MISQEQLNQLISENESLRVQLQDLDTIILQREEELVILREDSATATEMRSMMDQQLEQIQSMQNHIGKKQQQLEGGEERELELEQELTEAAKLQQKYNDLVQQYNYSEAQLSDIKEQYAELKKRNQLLQQIADKIGEVESHLANTVMERDGLMARIATLENAGAVSGL